MSISEHFNRPDVLVPPTEVMDEYKHRLSDVTAANIRLTIMLRTVTSQRDQALENWEKVARELQDRQKSGAE